MTEKKKTDFENKCNILSDLWIEYRQEESFKDFVDYNDLGLPLSFMLAEGLVKATDRANIMVEETFDLLLASLGTEDHGFESLEDLLSN